MESSTTITCTIKNSDVSIPLGLEIWLDSNQILNCNHVKESISFNHKLEDSNRNCELRFVLKNKKPEHTVIDESGNIVKDAVLSITELAFDEIQLGHLFTEHAVYSHDFNGSQDVIKTKFFGTMGCNGTVSLKFTMPVYIWLLENM